MSATIDRIFPGVAAIDIGSTDYWVAVAGRPVERFGTYTCDVRRVAAYLREQGVQRVAMEATGVYWIPLHDHLDSEGFEVTVFNGAYARNLPGRKTDVQDCQWHAMLHSHGLLSPCFIPPADIRTLRSYHRQREGHVEAKARCNTQMQKALDLLNVRIHNVISQLDGVSGLRVIEAILRGERNPQKLVLKCDAQIRKHKEEEVIASLEGTWEEHHLFALRQALEGYRFYEAQMVSCDREIDRLLKKMNDGKPPAKPKGRAKSRSKMRHNAPKIDELHDKLVTLCDGRDTAVLPGISPLGMLKLVGELGTDLTAWPSVKHFTSWLGLAPGNHSSGKSRRRVRRRKTRAGQIFKEAAMSIARSKNPALGAFYRRVRSKKGAAVANTATARKLAEMYYRAMTQGLEYVEEGVQKYNERCHEQRLRWMRKLARAEGLTLVPYGTAAHATT